MYQTRLGNWSTRLRLLQGLFFPEVAAHGHCSDWDRFLCRMIPQQKHIMVCHHTSNHVKCTSPRSKTLIKIWRDYLVYLKWPPLQVQQYMFPPMGEVATGKQHTYKTQKSQVCQNSGGHIQVQLRPRYLGNSEMLSIRVTHHILHGISCTCQSSEWFGKWELTTSVLSFSRHCLQTPVGSW